MAQIPASLRLALISVAVSAASWAEASASLLSPFNVLDFGARGDGIHDDTSAIQSAIDAAAAAAPHGCLSQAQVLLPAAHVFLSRPLWLASCVDLHVASGATLRSSELFDDYGFAWKASGFNYSIVGFVNGGRCVANNTVQCTQWAKLQNVTISGEGDGSVIDGSGPAWWQARSWWPTVPCPMLLDLFYVDNLIIRDVVLFQSAYWTIQPSLCRNVLIDGVRIEAGVERGGIPYEGWNIDGLDSNNVENMTLQNSIIHAGDDGIAINSRNYHLPDEWPTRGVTVRNVTTWTPLSLGSGTGNGVYDVQIEDCTVDPTGAGNNATSSWLPKWWRTAIRFKTARGRGTGPIANVSITNLNVRGVDLVLDFQSYYSCQNSTNMANYYRCRNATQLPPGPPGEPGPTFTNITVSGVRGDAWRSAWLNCLPERPCTGIVLRDFNVSGNPLYASSATGANGFVCENVHGSATGVFPPANGCFAGGL